jgi:hypothetical protein
MGSYTPFSQQMSRHIVNFATWEKMEAPSFWDMTVRQWDRDVSTQYSHLIFKGWQVTEEEILQNILLWLVDPWKSAHHFRSKRQGILKQRHIPRMQSPQIHRCENFKTWITDYVCTVDRHETFSDYIARAMPGWQCDLCTKLSQVKTLLDKTSTDDREDIDKVMKYCSRWMVLAMRNVQFHGRKYWSGSPVFWSGTFSMTGLLYRSIRVRANHNRSTYIDKSRKQWPAGPSVSCTLLYHSNTALCLTLAW